MKLTRYLLLCERLCIAAALEKSRGNTTRAAKIAGVHRTAFYKLLKRHGFKLENFRVTT